MNSFIIVTVGKQKQSKFAGVMIERSELSRFQEFSL